MRLNTLSPAEGSKKAGKRLGRGIGRRRCCRPEHAESG